MFFLISIALYVMHGLKTKHAIYGDGNGYYIIAHTLFFQRNFQFDFIYDYLSSFKGSSFEFSRIFWDSSRTVTGIRNTPWLIGTSIFWLFGLFISSLINGVFFLKLSNTHLLYEIGCGVTGIVLMLAGLLCLEKVLEHYITKEAAEKTIYILYFGTFLLYYSAFEPALSHQPVFFLVCLSLWIGIQKLPHIVVWGVLGMVTGLVLITRMADILLLIPGIIHVLLQNGFNIKRIAFNMKIISFFVFIFLLSILPQIYLQYVMYGDIRINPYLSGQKGPFYDLTLESVYNHLFSAGGGFFLWSPVFIIGLIGLSRLLWSKYRTLSIISLFTLLCYTILISAWNPIAPSGFGNRFFISAVPFFAIGIGHILHHNRKAYHYIVIVSILWNILLLNQFYSDKNRIVERRGLTVLNLISGQITVPIKTLFRTKF